MRASVVVISLLLGSTAANAQTTTCGAEFGKWVCRSQQAPRAPTVNIPDYSATAASAFAAGQAAAAARDQQRAAIEAQQEADQHAIVQGRVAAMVREGDCAGAKDLALRVGDMNLAQQAVTLCTPTQK